MSFRQPPPLVGTERAQASVPPQRVGPPPEKKCSSALAAQTLSHSPESRGPRAASNCCPAPSLLPRNTGTWSRSGSGPVPIPHRSRLSPFATEIPRTVLTDQTTGNVRVPARTRAFWFCLGERERLFAPRARTACTAFPEGFGSPRRTELGGLGGAGLAPHSCYPPVEAFFGGGSFLHRFGHFWPFRVPLGAATGPADGRRRRTPTLGGGGTPGARRGGLRSARGRAAGARRGSVLGTCRHT